MSFLPNLTYVSLFTLIGCPKLNYIECRRSDSKTLQYPSIKVNEASALANTRRVFNILVDHSDMMVRSQRIVSETLLLYYIILLYLV